MVSRIVHFLNSSWRVIMLALRAVSRTDRIYKETRRNLRLVIERNRRNNFSQFSPETNVKSWRSGYRILILKFEGHPNDHIFDLPPIQVLFQEIKARFPPLKILRYSNYYLQQGWRTDLSWLLSRSRTYLLCCSRQPSWRGWSSWLPLLNTSNSAKWSPKRMSLVTTRGKYFLWVLG